MEPAKFAESAKGFTKSPLGIIALFIVLVYGFASLVVGFGQNLAGHIAPLIYFMVLFPVIVFLGFLWLVAKHHRKLYGPGDFRDEDNFLKAQIESAALLGAAAAKDSQGHSTVSSARIDKITEVVVNARRPITENRTQKHILWVDDRPDNNLFERKALEAQGIEITLALSTNEALDLLSSNRYAAIISDMGRKEGPDEGYVLLETLRKRGDQTPFVIYAGSGTPEHKALARKKGAIGCTNRADELFQMVLSAI